MVLKVFKEVCCVEFIRKRKLIIKNKIHKYVHITYAYYFISYHISEYLKKDNTTIITVDWGRLAILPCYPTAAVNTKQAGECIGKFLLKLQKQYLWFNPIDVHFIGFSLGSHVAGYASNVIERIIKKKPKRITGKKNL